MIYDTRSGCTATPSTRGGAASFLGIEWISSLVFCLGISGTVVCSCSSKWKDSFPYAWHLGRVSLTLRLRIGWMELAFVLGNWLKVGAVYPCSRKLGGGVSFVRDLGGISSCA